MDTGSIASSLLLMQTDRTQQVLSTAMVKQAAAQQNQMANILARNVQQSPQLASQNGSGFSFSTYA